MSGETTNDERETRREAAEEIRRLSEIMTRLRGPEGCPWDRAQTHESLRPYLLEETYEVLEAIDSGDDSAHLEELGDLLLQIVFHAEIAREAGRWSLADVARKLSEKLLMRHPHVFGDVEAADPEAAYRSWEKVKAAERRQAGKPERKSILSGVPRAAPSLLRAERVSDKASHSGFDWPSAEAVRGKLDEEISELDEAIESGDRGRMAMELGDVLLTLANLGRFLKVHPEDALREAVERFILRFQHMESSLSAENKTPSDLDMDALEARWQAAKRATE